MSCCATGIEGVATPQFTQCNKHKFEEERLIAASSRLSNGNYKTAFIVPDMHCVACIGTIERGLQNLAPVVAVRANLSMKMVAIVWNPKSGSALEISDKLDALGFSHYPADTEADEEADRDVGKSLLMALAVAGFAAANIMLLSVSVWSGADQETAMLFHLISGLIAVPTVMYSGRPFFRSAIAALRAGRLNMDVPISLAVLLALGLSIHESLTGGTEAWFDASVTLLFFLLIGRYLDHMMREKARSAVQRLHDLSAKDGVLVSDDGELSHIALQEIRPGMRLRVFPGERFPVNGEVLCGNSNLDRSHITGESEPVSAVNGDVVEAGTLNLDGVVDVEARGTARESFLGEMQAMMEAAEEGRGKHVRIADRMASIYAPAVHILALASFIGWMFVTGGDWHHSLYVAIAVLIITCPCALGLAVPVTHVVAANRLMQNGILMRDGTALERLAEVDTVVFDKTGTLTSGSPAILTADEYDEELAPVLKALAAASSHPVAKSLNRFLGDTRAVRPENIREFPGFGIEAEYNGQKVRLGRPEWVAELASGSSIGQNNACSLSFVCEGEQPIHFATADTLRADARQAIYAVGAMKLDMEILSGDRQERVEAAAKELAIETFLAGQTPADKISRVDVLQGNGRKVLMLGDGINDAPALAAGHASMVPASASDIGRQSADFVFVRDSLGAVPLALDIARIANRTVQQNFAIALAYNAVAIPLAMAGYVTPLIAALAMSASSIAVVSNSLRISFSRAGISARNNQSQHHTNSFDMEYVH